MQVKSTDFENPTLRRIADGDHSILDEISTLDFDILEKHSIYFESFDLLSTACYFGHISIVQDLLNFSRIEDNVGARRNNALISAMYNNHCDIMRILLKYESVIENIIEYDNAELKMIGSTGSIDQLNELLNVEAVVDNLSAEGNYTLAHAAGNGYIDIVNKLLEYPSVVEHLTDNGNWALCMAAKNGHIGVVKRLIEFKSVSDSAAYSSNYALKSAAENCHFEMVNILLNVPTVVETLISINHETKSILELSLNNLLKIATEHKSFETIYILIEILHKRNNVGIEEQYLLDWSCANGFLGVLIKLLENIQVDPSSNNNSAIRAASVNGHIGVVNYLLEYPEVEINITTNSNEALKAAAENGHVEVVNRLLENQQVRDNVAAHSNRALGLTAKNGHIEVVNRLLEFQQVRDNISAWNNYALRFAAANGHIDVVNCLLEYPQVKDGVSILNNEALRLAARNCHYEIAHILARTKWPNSIKDIPQDLRECISAIKQGGMIANRQQEARKESAQLLRWLQEGCVPAFRKDLYLPPKLSCKNLRKAIRMPFDVMNIVNDYADTKENIDTSRPTMVELTMISLRSVCLLKASSSIMSHLEKARIEREKDSLSCDESALVPYKLPEYN